METFAAGTAGAMDFAAGTTARRRPKAAELGLEITGGS